MKRPAGKTLVLAHPVIATPLTLLGGVTLFAGFHAGNIVICFLAAAMLATVCKASEEASAYRAWAGEWNAMAPDKPRERKRLPRRRLLLGTLGLALFVLLYVGGENPLKAALSAGVMVGGFWLVGTVLWTTIRRLMRRRSQRTTSFAVSVVARPVMAVPKLADAYRALPSYCHVLLQGQK